MNLAELNRIPMKRKYRRRVGRGPGSGHGKTSGRGVKGQKSRSGHSRSFGFEGGQMPLFRRVPKKGFTNALFKVTFAIVNTGQLNVFDDESVVNLEGLKNAGLVKKNAKHVKILAKGALTTRLTVEAKKFSMAAKQMLEASGGTAKEIS